MYGNRDRDRQIVDSWSVNASLWIQAVRDREIESRKRVTDKAIVDAVMNRNPRSVLDLGCGEGWLARELHARGVEVIGVDVVPDLIDAAAQAGGGDFRTMSYEDVVAGRLEVSVDIVVCNFSLIGAQVVDDLISAAPSLLNAGGAFIIQTLHPVAACGDQPYVNGWREGSWAGFSNEFTDPAPWYFRTIEGWTRLFQKAGFSRTEISEPVHPDTQVSASIIFCATVSEA
jgi:2-polyprenyl-3-methyl-5-hydroxy-6-metoxy-1,4-benzoquinol methylase